MNRSDIKALDPNLNPFAILTEEQRAGMFVWTAGDFSALASADPLEGIYLVSDFIPATSGAWIREDQGDMRPEWFGALSGDRSCDTTPILNSISAIGKLARRSRVLFAGRNGNYFFNTKPNTLTCGLIIVGEGISLSGLARNYQPATVTEHFLHWEGGACNGGGLRDISVVCSHGTGGNLVSFTSPLGSALSYCDIDKVYISYMAGTWAFRALYIDGRLNDGSQGGQGVRDINVSRSFLFCNPQGFAALEARNVCVGRFSDIFTDGQQSIISGGGVSSGTNSNNVTVSGMNFTALTIEHCSSVHLNNVMANNVSIQATATNGSILGKWASFSNASASFRVV